MLRVLDPSPRRARHRSPPRRPTTALVMPCAYHTRPPRLSSRAPATMTSPPAPNTYHGSLIATTPLTLKSAAGKRHRGFSYRFPNCHDESRPLLLFILHRGSGNEHG